MTPLFEVDDYLAAAPSERQSVLNQLREACLEFLPGFTETLRDGIPSYERDDAVEIAFASRPDHLAFFVLRTDVLEAHRPRLGGLDVGEGCIRYSHPEKINLDVIHSILKMNALTSGDVN